MAQVLTADKIVHELPLLIFLNVPFLGLGMTAPFAMVAMQFWQTADFRRSLNERHFSAAEFAIPGGNIIFDHGQLPAQDAALIYKNYLVTLEEQLISNKFII